MLVSVKRRVFEILHVASDTDAAARAVNVFIMALIIVSVVSVVLETVKPIASAHTLFFKTVEAVTVAVFTVEYVLRLWTAPMDPRFAGALLGRVRFALTPLALVDLAAVAPFYIPMVFVLDLRFLRAVRLFRLFRLFKLGRYSRSLQTFGRVMADKKEDMVVTLFIVFLLIILTSSVMYFVESAAQPDKFSSIPAAMWWAVVTLTTVGYGDIYPITPVGKLLGTVVAILGIGVFALPTGILGSAFVEELQKRRAGGIVCPHCGKKIGGEPEERP